MSPEVVVNPPWRSVLRASTFSSRLAVVAVDEAHCIPEWLVCMTESRSLVYAQCFK